MTAKSGTGERGMLSGGTVQAAAFEGAKIWNSEIWPLLTNWHLHCRKDSAGSLVQLGDKSSTVARAESDSTDRLTTIVRTGKKKNRNALSPNTEGVR